MSSIELADLKWRKAQKSAGNGACVEVASFQDIVAVRDSKDPDGPVLTYVQAEWGTFLRRAKAGEFNGRC